MSLHLHRQGTEPSMSIWLTRATPEALNAVSKMTMADHLGIEFLEIGDDYIKARMPVDHRTLQPFGILHGGASATLAETLGSVAAHLCTDGERKRVVGLEINANHVRPATGGFVYGVTRPIHIGASTQIWEIRISNEQDKLVCISRLTLAVLDKEEKR
jgi:1,4-dihydroxy-2-naphthoyl-CoA hydrolase